MHGTKIQIAAPNSNTVAANQIGLSSSFLQRRNIPVHQPLLFQFGSCQQTVHAIDTGPYHGLHIGSELMQQTGLHPGVHIRLKYIPKTRTIVIGPLIGVLLNRTLRSADRPFGTVTPYCLELTEAAKRYGGFVYFFTPDDISRHITSIKAWNWQDRWRQRTFPVPDVVYNRLTTRKLENKSSVQQFMRDVKSQFGTHVFNERYINKTEVFAQLKNDASLVRLLPESYSFRNFSMLGHMVGKHKVVFLKPITGSLGKGIIRITRQGPSHYDCHVTSINGVKKQTYPSLTQLFSAISGRLKQQKYQIQQGIPLIHIQNHPVDFRALVQKNEKGSWAITSIVARIAGNEHFVSNLARGGRLSSVDYALGRSGLTPSHRALARSRLRTAARDIAKGIEDNVSGQFAEFGIDLAVDHQGNVWLIEVNSKPSKNENTALTDGKIRPSVKQFLKYCRYLVHL